MLLSMALLLLPLAPVGFAEQPQGCWLQSDKEMGALQEGDIVLAGSFPVNFYSTREWPGTPFSAAPKPITCYSTKYNVGGFRWSQAMAFAIREINQNSSFLWNVTVGMLTTDTCQDMAKTIHGALWILSGKEEPVPGFHCQKTPIPSVIIGTYESTGTAAIAGILGLFGHPQVSYSTSSSQFSDKKQFPSFLRTIPSNDYQAHGIARLVVYFGWTWVGILVSDEDYGFQASQILKKDLERAGICIAFHETLPKPNFTSILKVNRILEVIKGSSAKIVLAFTSGPFLRHLMIEYARLGLSGKTWIGSEAWSMPVYLPKEIAGSFSGTLGFAIHEGQMPGFTDHLLKVNPLNSPNDMFVQRFWETAFGCQWPKLGKNLTMDNTTSSIGKSHCSGDEKLEPSNSQYPDDSDLRYTYNIYNAVYAVAHALLSMQSCVPGEGPFANRTCAALHNIKPWQLLHYLKNVRFKNKLGEEMYFDHNGDPPATYDIINWQLTDDGNMRYVKVGKFDSSLPPDQELYFNAKAIRWNLQITKVPRSVCTESCAPGFRRAAQKGRPVCCFDCVPCAEGEVSNDTESSACWQCPNELWPNEGRSKCLPKRIEYLSYEDPLGAILAGLASLSSTLTAAILCVFIKYRGTPIVKANNRELTYFLLAGLVLGFLCSLLFIGEPRTITCLLRQPAFGIIFVFCVSCVLAKTIMVVIAFRATKPDSNTRRWLGPQVPIATVCLCTLGQVLICVSWLLLCPPYPQKNMNLKIGTIILQCNECSEIAFWCMLGYMGLLACVSFLVAFLARKLPDSFNEAKWITFSMFLFLNVWMYFILGYLSTQGKYMVAVEIFAIICSSAGLLFCIFFPKCYIILLRPDLNTKEQLLGKRTPGNKMKSS